jgi:formate--tetrahydrofolate ligase
MDMKELERADPEAVERGLPNLDKHIENIRHFGVPLVVAINRFPADTDDEIKLVQEFCRERGVEVAVSEVYERGGEGGIELAERVIALADSDKAQFKFLYEPEEPLTQKIEKIAKAIYGADGVEYTSAAKRKLARLEKHGYGQSLVCMAKTQDSLSDDPKLRGRPQGFTITVRDVSISAGAGFIVPLAGQIMTMPGLPTRPAAEGIDVDDEGNITGIF